MAGSDPMPAGILDYYLALDAGRIDVAAGVFTSGARYSVPRPAATGAVRADAVGRNAIRELLAARGVLPIRHDIELCLVSDASCLVAGRAYSTDTEQAVAAFIVRSTSRPNGELDTFRAYAAPAPDGQRSGADRSPDQIAMLLAAPTTRVDLTLRCGDACLLEGLRNTDDGAGQRFAARLDYDVGNRLAGGMLFS